MVRRFFLLVSFLMFGEGLQAQMSMTIEAKGMWIWKLWTANSGNLAAVIDKVKSVGVTWVVIKMADSDSYYNKSGQSLYNWASAYGGMEGVASTFHANGIKIMGYQYVYGIPHWGLGFSESDIADSILSVKGIDGLLVDAEIQYDTLSTRSATAQSYMDSIRARYPGSFVALTSWARVASHSTFPWVTFLSRVDINMPQTYWAARPTTPATELSRMSNDFTSYTQTWVNQGYSAAAKPIMPLGQAEYFGYSNDVQAGDISTFCTLSQSTYSYRGVSLWEYTQITHSYVWDEYAAAWQVTSISGGSALPSGYGLSQNYPNPFNPSTVIRFHLPTRSRVRLDVFNILGERVASLVNEERGAGLYSEQFNAAELPTGVYIYRLEAGSFVTSKKLLLIK
jgi:hypothetical protein